MLLPLVLASAAALAQTANSDTQEWAKRIKTAQTVGALGSNLFGDSTNFYNGQTTFSVTDVDLPGNNALPVRVSRTLVAAHPDRDDNAGLMSNWDLDLPYVSGVYPQGYGWRVAGTQPYNRCSSTTPQPPSATNAPIGVFQAHEFWRGNTLNVPGYGNQTLLTPNIIPAPTDGQTTRRVTAGFWQIR